MGIGLVVRVSGRVRAHERLSHSVQLRLRQDAVDFNIDVVFFILHPFVLRLAVDGAAACNCDVLDIFAVEQRRLIEQGGVARGKKRGARVNQNPDVAAQMNGS